jgi:copper chaperone
MRSATIHITGMSCGHCLHAVQRALRSLSGVQLDSLQMGRALVSYDESVIDPATIETAIADAGYTAVIEGATARPSGAV